MGYETQFHGSLSFWPPLSEVHEDYLKAFCAKSFVSIPAGNITNKYNDWHVLAGLKPGDGGVFYIPAQPLPSTYYVKAEHPGGVPSEYCGLRIHNGQLYIEDGKNYTWQAWLSWLNKNLIKPWGYQLFGEIEWVGEEPEDRGKVVALRDGQLEIHHAEITWVKSTCLD